MMWPSCTPLEVLNLVGCGARLRAALACHTRYCCFFDHVRRDSPCDGDYKLNRLRSRGRVYQVEGHDNMIKN
jgi:hypothetical protein